MDTNPVISAKRFTWVLNHGVIEASALRGQLGPRLKVQGNKRTVEFHISKQVRNDEGELEGTSYVSPDGFRLTVIND